MFVWSKNFLLKILAQQGRRVTRYPLAQYLRDFEIDCVLDVGANVGQYASEIRGMGYQGRIESFEPIPDMFEKLKSNSENDPKWHVHKFALGSENCVLPMNISVNSPSSSFLNISNRITTDFIDLSTIDTVNVEVKRMDAVFPQIRQDAKNVFLKIDTQGFERNVIEGGINSLTQIRVVQMELALVSNYESEALIEEMILLMRKNDFSPWWILDGFRNPKSLQLFQADVIFVRSVL